MFAFQEKEKIAFAISILPRRNNLETSFETFLPKRFASHRDSFSLALHCLSSFFLCLFFNMKIFSLSLVIFLLFTRCFVLSGALHLPCILFISPLVSVLLCPCYVLLTDSVMAGVLPGRPSCVLSDVNYRHKFLLFFFSRTAHLDKNSLTDM